SSPRTARLYITGVGLYEANINGSKVGNEYLTPYCNDYSSWLQIQSYDVTEQLTAGINQLSVMLGLGWAIGRFGLGGGKEQQYAEFPAMIAELYVELEDGTAIVISTDETWKAQKSPILTSGIYDGETWDANAEQVAAEQQLSVIEVDKPVAGQLSDRLSLPVVCKQALAVAELMTTPQGHTVLDFGQNMSGWVVFEVDAPKDTVITLR